MKGPRDLLHHEDNWLTRMGLVFAGERVIIRGKDLFHDLYGMRWMELFLYALTGRNFDQNQIRLFEGMWSLCTSYPDPRIWNNRVASLAGTARSTCTLGLAAAIAVSEAKVYGRQPDIQAIDFLVRTKGKIDAGIPLLDIIQAELSKFRGIAGFARPIVNRDERIKPLLDLASSLGLADGEYVHLVFSVQEKLHEQRYRMNMNVAALGAALAADQGLSSYEYYLFLNPSFIGGIIPCYIEAAERAEGTFLPLSCQRVVYEGVANRSW